MYGDLVLKEVAKDYSTNSYKLIIACVDRNLVKLFFSDWEWINLGLVVSEQLHKLPVEARSHSIVDIVRNELSNISCDNIVVENIDLLFSPEYSLDVLKLFTLLGKTKRLIVIWDGTFKDGLVTYSEPGSKDYHKYEIKNFNAYCITK